MPRKHSIANTAASSGIPLELKIQFHRRACGVGDKNLQLPDLFRFELAEDDALCIESGPYAFQVGAAQRHMIKVAGFLAASARIFHQVDKRVITGIKPVAADTAKSIKDTGVDLEVIAAHGKPAEALVEEAKRRNAELIVVGNRRVQGIGRILGSVARSVAQHAPCDVYIVKTV